jgi:fluoride exporter
MDDPSHDRRPTLAAIQPGRSHHDRLDEPVLPALGLSPLTILAVAVGGALGTVARYLLEGLFPAGPGHIPWTTLLINLSGSFAIGFLVPLIDTLWYQARLLRPFLLIGFLGGWTTYSTLAVETTLLIKHGALGESLAYLAATVVGGLGLVVIGHALGRKVSEG